jgi:hypothetical protein
MTPGPSYDEKALNTIHGPEIENLQENPGVGMRKGPAHLGKLCRYNSLHSYHCGAAEVIVCSSGHQLMGI